jgi:hypothetical protein
MLYEVVDFLMINMFQFYPDMFQHRFAILRAVLSTLEAIYGTHDPLRMAVIC